ncbi:MAG TPA: class IV adenylate cyclase [Terriglobia bacterium]|nr:class IV adenylate cyclase [Terriglobia bacterium]
MKPQREIEIKLKVSNPRKLKRLLRELGFRALSPRRLERNFLFDFRDGRLVRAGCALRLRAKNGRHWLTYKGAARTRDGYKSREEIESSVESEQALRQILLRLGLKETFAYSKHRTEYALGQSDKGGKSRNLLVYDETPVGNFIELEGPRRWIDQMARELGYRPEDYVTASYVSLYREGSREVAAKKGGRRG